MYYEKAVVYLTDRYCRNNQEKEFPKNHWKVAGRSVLPAIPFVGKDYFNQPKGQRVLVYASAENLTWCTDDKYAYYCELDGMLRCRDNFEKQGENPDEYENFPNVHIQPIHDGGLLIAVNRIMKKLFGHDYAELPREFIERICCANYGKFTVYNEDNEKINKDYAGNKKLVDYSLPYVKADIDILNPDIIIMPKSMYWNGQKDELAILAKGKTIICIPQINTTNVNCHLFNQEKSDAGIYDQISLTETEKSWKSKLHGFNQDKFLSVYDYMDHIEENLYIL